MAWKEHLHRTWQCGELGFQILRSSSRSSPNVLFHNSGEAFPLPVSVSAGSRYRYFILLRMPIISGEANAMPRRMAAHPHALEKVCSTMRFGYRFKFSRKKVLRRSFHCVLHPVSPTHQTGESAFNLATEQVIAGRIVGRADKNQFGMSYPQQPKLSAEN